MIVNDVHSRLNPIRTAGLRRVDSLAGLRAGLAEARARRLPVTVAGGRHAMGGQQFATDGLLLDTTAMDRVLDLDRDRGLVEVEAGIQWPALVAELQARQPGAAWTIAQKQTGADRFSVGGSVSANVHGRGLAMGPLVSDVESLRLLRPDGSLVTCSRSENAELFALAVGGYGLVGALYAVTLRLVPRHVLERVVEVRDVDGLTDAFAERVAAGFTYGDFQFEIDPASPGFLRRGVFSCYRPVDEQGVPAGGRALSGDDWTTLLALAHTDKGQAFERYAEHYLATSGQRYFSDDHQLATYLDDYHRSLDRVLAPAHPGTEMISELFVPRERLTPFLAALGDELRAREADLIYGTVRSIEPDDVTFLPWARCAAACVVLNLHVEHTPWGIADAAATFRALIDVALRFDGTYYPTYHRFADREQVLRAHPRMPAFLAAKRRLDPEECFASDWYRHHRALLDEPGAQDPVDTATAGVGTARRRVRTAPTARQSR